MHKIVIETDDIADLDLLLRFLRGMQKESDEMADEYGGTLALETQHMSIGVRIVGIFTGHTQDGQACIEPIF
jgi:hypothetical protein